jgi:hypothetical protein
MDHLPMLISALADEPMNDFSSNVRVLRNFHRLNGHSANNCKSSILNPGPCLLWFSVPTPADEIGSVQTSV